MKIYQIILVTIFSFLYNFSAYTQSKSNEKEKDSILVNIISCGCFLDSSSGKKKENCYFAIYNYGKKTIYFPKQLAQSIFYSSGFGLLINYEIFFIKNDTIDVTKMYEIRNHPKYKIDKRIVELAPNEEYYVHIILSDLDFPYNGKYKIRFSIEPENGIYGTKGLKNAVHSKWLEIDWTYSKENYIKH